MSVSTNTVLGKYRIIREIARSNDIVYEAIDSAMARRVAVKELQLPPHLAGAQKRERIERFYREAKAAGTLSHRNVVTIHDVGQENDRHFLVMEYLEGQNLRDILQMQGALPLKETLEITLQLCEALAYAHSRGIVHRDIKPDNVHILPGGIIKLTDFGIARITAEPSITSHGQVFGTPSYMSPEQVASHSVDHRTDLFSLGITLYEMLAGRKPFLGDSVITITYNIMNIQPTMPPGLPPALQKILQRSLAKDPSLRYQNAAAMAADLRAEKFTLNTASSPSAAASPTSLPSAPSSPPLNGQADSLRFNKSKQTLETGTVPSEISGIPQMRSTLSSEVPSSFSSGQASPQAVSNSDLITEPISEPVFTPTGSHSLAGAKFMSLGLPILALLLFLSLMIWGLRMAIVSLQARHQRTLAGTLAAQAATALQQGRYPEAASRYGQAAVAAPLHSAEAQRAYAGEAQAYAAQAQAYAQAHNMRDAVTAYQSAVAIDSSNAAMHFALGNACWEQGNIAGALDAWSNAVQADPTSAAGKAARQSTVSHCMDLAQTAIAAGDVASARNFWQRITQIDPGSDAAFQAQQNISRTATSPAPPSLGGSAN